MLLLFFGSGCAALVYEVVWFQLLQLVIGSSAVSLGVLLGTFMGGMCLGSFVLPRYLDVRQHPLRVYAYLELGIGVMGLVLLFGMPLVNGLYTGIGGGNIFFRAIVASMCLLPPTLMMGATLPAIARYVETSPRGVSWLGFFYGGNIGGAVLGSLLAGFYLLRVYDMAITTYVAVALNVLVARPGAPDRRHGALHASHDEEQRRGRGGAGCHGGVCDDCALGHDGAVVRSHLDAAAVAALWRDDLHVFADSRRLPVRPWYWQQRWARPLRGAPSGRASRSAGARCCSAAPLPGRAGC